jgi:hypothetical protein
MTVSEAATYLNVSPEFVFGLISRKEIRVDTFAEDVWVDVGSVVAWKQESYRKRVEALDELARLGEEMGVYDSE